MANSRLTEDRARRLAFVRQLLLGAETEAELAEPLCVKALLTLHDSAELFLVLAAEATGAKVKAGAGFLEYWDPIDQAISPETLGHKASMRSVSDARRTLKHSGVMPARSEIQRFSRSTRDFLEDGVSTVFQVQLHQVSLIDLIPVDRVRAALHEAETAITNGDALTALEKARLAFELAMRDRVQPTSTTDRIARAISKRRLRALRPSALRSALLLKLGDKVGRDFATAWDEVVGSVSRTENAVRLIAAGINYDEYLVFDTTAPPATWLLGAEEPRVLGQVPDGTLDEAKECLEFATRASLAILTK